MSLYDQLTWDKYQLDRLAGDTFKRNTLIEETAAAAGDPANLTATLSELVRVGFQYLK